MPPEILLLDDEPKLASLLARSLTREGYTVTCESDPLVALQRLKERPIDVLITDLRMPQMDGLEVLARARVIRPSCEVIVMTAYATVETAREALKRGAIDYLTKPFSADDDLKPLLRKVLAADPGPAAPAYPSTSGSADDTRRGGARGGAPLAPGIASPATTPGTLSPVSNIITRSPLMTKLLERLQRVAASNASVLLRGESGTGKELLANAIHALSPRAGGPLVKVNCGALTETLLEGELFGHMKGSFTGAIADREGLFEAAHGGTIFLDEIGEVSPALQVKLLRVLQEGEFQRVGDTRTRHVDVRVVAATNRDLEAMMKAGQFRQDLFYRLNVVPLQLPSLRERREDIPLLIEYFCGRLRRGVSVSFAPDALAAMQGYPWPGNIRELENAVEHALVLGDPKYVKLEDLPVTLQEFQLKATQPAGPEAVGHATLEDIERRCLLAALQKTNYNRTRAARLLGITRRTLGYRIQKYELEEEITRMRGGVVDSDSEEGDDATE